MIMACQCIRDLPRQEDVFDDCVGSAKGTLPYFKKTCLTQEEMAIRSREVYYSLVPDPGTKFDMESLPEWKREALKLNLFLLEEAANLCGLNGQKFSRWYLAIRRATGDQSPLDLKEFQRIVERFAQFDRDMENIRSSVEEYLKKTGRKCHFDLNNWNKYQELDRQYKPRCTSEQRTPSYCPCVGHVDPRVDKVIRRGQAIRKKYKETIAKRLETRKFWH